MTQTDIRNNFAALAMQAYIQADPKQPPQIIAAMAYQMADWMMERQDEKLGRKEEGKP